jgi:hypothetical protein
MASRCRLLFGQKVFAKHDNERYNNFIFQAAKNALGLNKGAKVNIGSVLPHELTIKSAETKTEYENMELNLQWLTMVQSMKENKLSSDGIIGDWLPLCDVSGSMYGPGPSPVDVAIALSLLMAQSSYEEGNVWGGLVMSFHEYPRIFRPRGIPKALTKDDLQKATSFEEIRKSLGDLKNTVNEFRRLPWGEAQTLKGPLMKF